MPETTEGYAKAEVTAGGIDTSELSAKTMESRIPGLFFIGEVVDVTGHLGGFNFQWAWASGAAAGRACLKIRLAEIPANRVIGAQNEKTAARSLNLTTRRKCFLVRISLRQQGILYVWMLSIRK